MSIKTYVLREDPGGQWSVTIPKLLANQVGIEAGDHLQIIVGRGELIIKKVEVKT